MVITFPRVAELATPRRDRAARDRCALTSHGMGSVLDVEELGGEAWPSPNQA